MISSWSTCHKILHILMFITSFEEQNITYRSCSNLRIHLCVECRKDVGIIDEIPSAYKDIDAVIANQSDLIDVVHTLKQILCIKG
ncbi:hypothetical protein EGT42_13190 [Acinetobacter haemolyticus]|nr:hypothetical protein EGT42_13190 [Acinetobacter haemolyticus]